MLHLAFLFLYHETTSGTEGKQMFVIQAGAEELWSNSRGIWSKTSRHSLGSEHRIAKVLRKGFPGRWCC